MNDFLNEAYELLKENSIIKEKCDKRISFYQYNQYEDETKPFIVLRPIEAVNDTNFGSNQVLQVSQIIQIDVQAKDRKDCKIIMHAVAETLGKKNWKRMGFDSLDTYLDEVKRYVLAYRFYFVSQINEINY